MKGTPALHQAIESGTKYENCDCTESSLLLPIGSAPLVSITVWIRLFDQRMRKIALSFYQIDFASKSRNLHACYLLFALFCACTRSSQVKIVWGQRNEGHIWFEQPKG